MNRVFVSGTVQKKPEVMYTPQGERIITFVLWVEDGAFPMEVLYMEPHRGRDVATMEGTTVMVAGTLTKKKGKGLTVKAHKIQWMEA